MARISTVICGLAVGVGLGCALPAALQAQAAAPSRDWTQFGWDTARTSANPESTGITAGNVARLTRRQVTLPGTVDASAIYLHGVEVKGARHNAIFVTTTYGKTLAIDADSGAILWDNTPASYAQLAGTRQITNTTPIADPDRSGIYTQTPDGMVRKLAVSDGHELWSTAITRLPAKEKMDSTMNLYRGRLVAVTAGYVGDYPPYQGHVAVLDPASGKLEHVWNSLCSDRTGLLDPATCAESDSAIWGRSGPVIDPASGDIFVATGNAKWDGKSNWGDALIWLNPDATRMLGNYTPANTAQLDEDDADLGSTSPALLPGGLIAQGGKDRLIHLVTRAAIAGAAPHLGHEAQNLPTPSGQRLFASLAVWRDGAQTWVFGADEGGTAAWRLENGKLESAWKNTTPGTTPVEAGGLLFVYAPGGRRAPGPAGLRVYQAASGKLLTVLACGAGHWNSPIVVDGKVILPEGNANQRQTTGVLDIWQPSRR